MNGQNRSDIYPGLEVDIILKKDQRSGKKNKRYCERSAYQFGLSFARHQSTAGGWAGGTSGGDF